MTLRAGLRLLLLAAMLLAPVGRIGMAQAMPGHCQDMAMQTGTTPHHKPAQPADDRVTIDCLVACAAMLSAPGPALAPPSPVLTAEPVPAPVVMLGGLHPDAELPPPRRS